jgi:hypothetical protein
MNDALELLLKDTFDHDAQDAPVAVRLAEGARGRLRRRRRALGGAVAAAAVVVVSALAWGGPVTTRSSGPAGEGGTTVVPNRSAGMTCTTAATCPEITALRRPLALPAVPPGTACPVSASHTMPQGGGFSTDYPAVGDGPFRLTGPPQVRYEDPPPVGSSNAGTGWLWAKTIWHVDPGYSGPLLLRGGRIDGPGALRFDHYLGALDQGDEPTGYPDLAYPAATGDPGLRTMPSGVYFGGAGCYAIQVDGTTFSQVIVFQTVPLRP